MVLVADKTQETQIVCVFISKEVLKPGLIYSLLCVYCMV